MSKEIPKRDGQKFNGVFPSVFALAFLMVGVPVLSTMIVQGALYLGDESKYVSSYSSLNVLAGEGDYPFWVQSGDGPDAKCVNQYSTTLAPGGPNCTANATNAYSITQAIAAVSDGEVWHQGLPHCSSSSTSNDCGDSGYILTQNITSRLEIDRIFPSMQFVLANDIEQACNDDRTGDSKVDFTITISHMIRSPTFANTNIWTYGELFSDMTMSGVYDFDNYVEVADDPCMMITQIEVQYDMNFVEIDQLTNLLDAFWNNRNESFGIYLTLELDNLRTERGYPWSNVGFYNPLTMGADGNHELYIDFIQLKADPFNTFLKFGVIGMGLGFWFIALASTPYWDPFIKKVKEKRGNE